MESVPKLWCIIKLLSLLFNISSQGSELTPSFAFTNSSLCKAYQTGSLIRRNNVSLHILQGQQRTSTDLTEPCLYTFNQWVLLQGTVLTP